MTTSTASSTGRNVLVALLRNDLRLHDSPIFSLCNLDGSSSQATSNKFKKPVTHLLPIYVLDEKFVETGGLPDIRKKKQSEARTRIAGFWRTGEHRVSFLLNSLFDVRSGLQKKGSDLSLWAGCTESIVPAIVKSLQDRGDNVEGVWMGKEINTEEVATERNLSSALSKLSTPVPLHTPVHKSLVSIKDLGFSLKELPDIFTHFRKKIESLDPSLAFRDPLPTPQKLPPLPDLPEIADSAGIYHLDEKKGLSDLKSVEDALCQPLRNKPTLGSSSDKGKATTAFPFKGGETEGLERLKNYFGSTSLTGASKNCPAATYKETRNGMLGVDYSTKFSAWLAHGCVSPRLIAARTFELDRQTGGDSGKAGGILFELLWRDYFYFVGQKFGSAMFTLGGIEEVVDPQGAKKKNYQWLNPAEMGDGKWDDGDDFVRWAKGETGVPMIDANMKELVRTGFMSNRGRQNVASFLNKDLGYDWRLGAEFFESHLTDYDTNSNWGNWQYSSGTGNDPRSDRQFNPIKQGLDYDKDGAYLRAQLPALQGIASPAVHFPWTLPGDKKPKGYPEKPILEQPSWRKFYSGGGGGGERGGRGGSRGGRGNGGRRGRGGGGNAKRGGHGGPGFGKETQ